VLATHDLCDLGDDIRMLARDVMLLAGIRRQVVQFDVERVPVGAAKHFATNALVAAEPDGLLPAAAGKLAVKEWTGRLIVAEQRGREADAVDLLRHGAGMAD